MASLPMRMPTTTSASACEQSVTQWSLAPGSVGTCGRETSSRAAHAQGESLRERWRALNSPRGLPLRSQVRFFRRHGPRVVWPVYAVSPYVRALWMSLRGLLRRPLGVAPRRRTPQDQPGVPDSPAQLGSC